VFALWVDSVARTVFMTSQLYRRLSALSVLSRYCCSRVSTASCDTTLMLFRSTSPLGDRASPPQVRLSVSYLPLPRTPSFAAERNGSLWRHDNRKKIDFKQSIIDFQEKTILTSLTVAVRESRLKTQPDVLHQLYDCCILRLS